MVWGTISKRGQYLLAKHVVVLHIVTPCLLSEEKSRKGHCKPLFPLILSLFFITAAWNINAFFMKIKKGHMHFPCHRIGGSVRETSPLGKNATCCWKYMDILKQSIFWPLTLITPISSPRNLEAVLVSFNQSYQEVQLILPSFVFAFRVPWMVWVTVLSSWDFWKWDFLLINMKSRIFTTIWL